MIPIDDTHDASRSSWVSSANAPDSEFPLQNLPLGVFQRRGGAPRIGVAIGDQVLDLPRAFELGLLPQLAPLESACKAHQLNALLALGRPAARALRRAVFDLLEIDAPNPSIAKAALVPAAEVDMLLPADIGDFSDFYTSIHHARRGSQIARPNTPPLYPNFRHLPVAYHGRSSSVVPSGTPCRRPQGQSGAAAESGEAAFHATAKLDFELEVGFYVGPGNRLGVPIGLDEAEEHLFGLCLVNDWSARDFQRWESQPLGPFQSKSFMTGVSPWIVTLEALAPFRTAAVDRGVDAPAVARRLSSEAHTQHGAIGISLEVRLQTARMRAQGEPAATVTRTNFAHQYWSVFQMLTHHTSNGCNLRSGDLISSGTVSGEDRSSAGCLFELTLDGEDPLSLPNGEKRAYLQDGDEVQLLGRCVKDGFRTIGFGACKAQVEGAVVQT